MIMMTVCPSNSKPHLPVLFLPETKAQTQNQEKQEERKQQRPNFNINAAGRLNYNQKKNNLLH